MGKQGKIACMTSLQGRDSKFDLMVLLSSTRLLARGLHGRQKRVVANLDRVDVQNTLGTGDKPEVDHMCYRPPVVCIRRLRSSAKIGLVYHCFACLHVKHVYLIIRAKRVTSGLQVLTIAE